MRTHKKYFKDGTGFYYSQKELANLQTLCIIAKELDNRHAFPATSGNLSVRASETTSSSIVNAGASSHFLITRSGYHKKFSTPAHFLRVNLSGEPVSDFMPRTLAPKPSDETKLHATIYSLFPEIGAIVHCHPRQLELLKPPHHKFSGHELLKALGFKTHTEDFDLPVFKNSQDMECLASEVKKHFSTITKTKSPVCAFYLERHGIYCFGKNPQDAFNKLEVFLHNHYK